MRVLVIGTGFGERAAAPAYRDAGFDVEVVSPRDDAAVQRALRSDLDLVSVHSPPFLHLEHVRGAIDHGHAVLCDKPFGRTGQEAQAMRNAARDAGVPHFLNFEFRHRQSWAKLKQLVDDGTIGAPAHLTWTFFSRGFRGRKHGWINDAELGGGWIGAFGSHLIDFTQWLFDSEVADCGGVTRIEDPQHRDQDGVLRHATAEDAYSAWFVLENGGTAAHDTAGAAGTTMPPRGVLTGTSGSVETIADATLVVRRPGADTETVELTPPGPTDSALAVFFAQVADSLRSGVPISPSFDDGVAVAQAMDLLRANVTRTPT